MKALVDLGTSLDVLAEEEPQDSALLTGDWSVLPCRNTSLAGRYLWGRRFVAEIRDLVAQTDYSYCYMRYSVQFAPLIPAVKKALGNVPLVLELNSFGSQRGGLYRVFLAPLEANALNSADLVLCVSDRLHQDVAGILGGAVADRCFVVPNGVDPERFPPPTEIRRDGEAKTDLCYCGVIKAGYGLEDLLGVHRELESRDSAIALHIIGEGPHRQALANSARRGQNVVFHGGVPFGEVPSLLAEMDILIYTTTETNVFQSPLKLYEYMCTGRPIVAADTPQTRQVLAGDQPAGSLFAVGDPSHLTGALQRLLDDPVSGLEMAGKAREIVVAEHTWPKRMATLQQELRQRRILGG